MDAIRRVEQVAGAQLVIDLPTSFQGRSVEVIVLKLPGDEQATAAMPRRQPPAALVGKMALHDDLLEPVVPESDWEAR